MSGVGEDDDHVHKTTTTLHHFRIWFPCCRGDSWLKEWRIRADVEERRKRREERQMKEKSDGNTHTHTNTQTTTNISSIHRDE